ncbi:uncharacterized protein LOC119352193 [Triticum dicoccoides]|uniref:uncharacterized protein LOC119352193 n=1 Tax=Triticum dicoccoides TaxID=85692 RepID=UPI000842A704|nr:uncharacterized protein LOC119352193 [Triticum dicoccoides]XP_044454066.1 uncharacterized protein LOC123186352 [Triticum aestivum]
MAVHVVLLAVPALVGGFLHAFKFSILLWPFNLTLPLLRHLPRVCATLRAAAAHFDAELRALLSGRRQRAPVPQLDHQYSALRPVQRRPRPAGQLVAQAMLALVDVSY